MDELTDSDELKRRKTQEFFDSIGEVPSYEKADFEPWLGQSFSLRGPDGVSPVLLKLDEIVDQPENQMKRRPHIRRFPFILEFEAPDAEELPEQTYVLTPETDSGVSFTLHVKPLDHVLEQQLMVYESILN